MPSSDNKTPKGLQNLSAMNFGWTAGVGFFVCFGVGYWVDGHFGTGFRWTVVGFLAGISLMFYELWKVVKNLDKTPKKKK